MIVEEDYRVIIVGAGPVGLLVALRLGQQGVRTLVLEAHETLLPTTRAMVYMPVVNKVLRDLGILGLVMKHAFLNKDGVVWRDIQGDVLAHLPLGTDSAGKDFEGVLLIGQARMNGLVLQELKKYPSVEVRFSHRCVGIEDLPNTDLVSVMVAHKNVLDGDEVFKSRFVLGTDGTNSSVRRMMCIPFEGFTWPDFRMVGTDINYDFRKENGWTPLNFVVHDVDCAVIAYTGEDSGGLPHGQGISQWRVAFLEDSRLSSAKGDVWARAYEKIPRYLRGSKAFEITRADVFWMHQRCAKQGRKGRVLLAGDALHCNNPVGGLGLTCGILDAFAYGNAFVRVLIHGETDTLLTECAESRRQAWLDATNQLSTANLKRIRSIAPEDAMARQNFFNKLKTDPDFPAQMRRAMDDMLPSTFLNQATMEVVTA